MSKIICINSGDRDWYRNNMETPYKYRIIFGSSQTNKSIFVNDIENNINSIKILKSIIPAREHYNGFSPLKMQSLLINILNIENVSNSSNSATQNALAILQPKNQLTTTDTYFNLEFDNVLDIYKSISDKSYRYLDIEILNNDGVLINNDNNQNDVLLVYQIVYYSNISLDNTNHTKLLRLKVEAFSDNDYKIGDILKIKNYIFRESSLNYKETAQFNVFINRNEGHIIQDIGKSDISNELFNYIYILPDIEKNTTTLSYELKSWFNSLIIKTSIDDDENDDTNEDNPCKLLNFNLQTNLYIKIN